MAVLHARIGLRCTSGRNVSVSSKAAELYISCHIYIKYVIIKQDGVKSTKKQKKGENVLYLQHRIYLQSGVFLFRAPCRNGE
jgi:hypothetical protein